jgi:hypothetical protein
LVIPAQAGIFLQTDKDSGLRRNDGIIKEADTCPSSCPSPHREREFFLLEKQTINELAT